MVTIQISFINYNWSTARVDKEDQEEFKKSLPI